MRYIVVIINWKCLFAQSRVRIFSPRHPLNCQPSLGAHPPLSPLSGAHAHISGFQMRRRGKRGSGKNPPLYSARTLAAKKGRRRRRRPRSYPRSLGREIYEKVLSDATFLFPHQDKKDLITRKRERKRFKGRDFQCGEFACVWALVG